MWYSKAHFLIQSWTVATQCVPHFIRWTNIRNNNSTHKKKGRKSVEFILIPIFCHSINSMWAQKVNTAHGYMCWDWNWYSFAIKKKEKLQLMPTNERRGFILFNFIAFSLDFGVTSSTVLVFLMVHIFEWILKETSRRECVETLLMLMEVNNECMRSEEALEKLKYLLNITILTQHLLNDTTW